MTRTVNRDHSSARWEHFDHDADIGVRGIGQSLAEAFEQTALAMTATVTSLSTIRSERATEIACEAADPEVLLVDWLNALVYEMAVRNMLFSRFEVHIDHGKLNATVWGETVDVARHQPAVEIKGATYTALRVGRRGDGQWVAETVVDV